MCAAIGDLNKHVTARLLAKWNPHANREMCVWTHFRWILCCQKRAIVKNILGQLRLQLEQPFRVQRTLAKHVYLHPFTIFHRCINNLLNCCDAIAKVVSFYLLHRTARFIWFEDVIYKLFHSYFMSGTYSNHRSKYVQYGPHQWQCLLS